MYKLFKLRIYLVATTQFGITILPYVQTIDLSGIVMSQMVSFLATLTVCTQEYLFGVKIFTHSMYQQHRYEFKKHAIPIFVLSLAVLISLLCSMLVYYFVSVVSGCMITQTSMGIDKSIDLCFSIFSIKVDDSLPIQLYLLYILLEMFPFIFFFILNKPHDCFICLGKDPERRFSMFQLTREELE